MECTCGFDCDIDGDSADFHDVTMRRARKQHACCECRRTILPGEMYQHVAGKWGGSLNTYDTCAECAEIRGALCLGSWLYTSLWEDIQEQVFPEFITKCLDALSPPARAKLVDAFDDWMADERVVTR